MSGNATAVLNEHESVERQEPTERIENCPKHGEFTARRSLRRRDWYGEPVYGWSHCPKCKEEQQLAEAARRAESDRQYRAEFIAARIKNSGIPMRFQGKSLENYQVETEEQRTAVELCRRYVAEAKVNVGEGRCLLFCGTVGTGKTHLACAILHAVASMGGRLRYFT